MRLETSHRRERVLNRDLQSMILDTESGWMTVHLSVCPLGLVSLISTVLQTSTPRYSQIYST
jgi:hypothetical protein